MNLGEKMMFKNEFKKYIISNFRNTFLSACSTAKKSGDIEGDVYTGKETVEYSSFRCS